MRILNILMIVLLGVYLVIGGLTIWQVYHTYEHVSIPPPLLKRLVYPYQLFEGLCVVATIYVINRFLKKAYAPAVYVAFVFIILSGIFFALHK
ncbi:hypothetical protein [Mucilaginibacter ginkgonis]|uniref:Uncharacterized protein n=1 Tax=Mucilaginibacter ginkgonis TaxID=2682091 RepID=A0A6I4IN73_9SPHI|nr:hypothetical protein [Mucilaginibacter ginkgonis]QQL51286.1 hypothetical protein GO620_007530 [Mucilaginibacter ginkgonis]